jgi:hypothetical protein
MVAASAAKDRSRDGSALEKLLERTEEEISRLEKALV